jgi:polyphosphate kinase 2 (PPK2 family)
MAKKRKNTNGAKSSKLNGEQYESELRRLQGELCALQAWVKNK